MKEMTVKEICDELGYEVKVVKESPKPTKKVIYHLAIMKDPDGGGMYKIFSGNYTAIDKWNGSVFGDYFNTAWTYTKSELQEIAKIIQEFLGE